MAAKQASQEIDFGDLINLTNREIQMTLREVNTKDLAFALKGAKQTLQARFLSNVSERVGTMIKGEMKALGRTKKSDQENVRARIVQIVDKLIQAGHVSPPPWPPQPQRAPRSKRRLGKEYLAKKRAAGALVKRSLSDLSLEEINRMFVGLAEVGRNEGILALEKMMQGRGDRFLASGLRLAVDGTEPELVQAILRTWMRSLMHEHEVKYRKVMEGMMSIQSGDNPRIVEQKLNVLY